MRGRDQSVRRRRRRGDADGVVQDDGHAARTETEVRNGPMITLYHCLGARSFRPLWMLEELKLAYELKMLPFPPRDFANDYLAINPLGTIPFMIDGETRMTESSAICHYLGTRYGPTDLIVDVKEP